MPETTKLTTSERLVAVQLSLGHSTKHIGHSFDITEATARVHAANIWKKTGFHGPRRLEQLSSYLYKTSSHESPKPRPPSPAQLRILQLVAEGHGHTAIAEYLRVTIATVANHMTQGCKRLNIPAFNRRAALQAHFATQAPQVETFPGGVLVLHNAHIPRPTGQKDAVPLFQDEIDHSAAKSDHGDAKSNHASGEIMVDDL